MRTLSRVIATATLGAAVVATAGVGGAAAAPQTPTPHVVFVQNDNPSGNVIFAYNRSEDGTLTLAGSNPTGGLGGALAGSVVDHLASQGALTLDPAHKLLFAVNAGSDTVSVFAVDGDRLALRQTLPSGGSFPVSITVSGDLAYVLDARDGGAVSGFRIDHQHVQPIAGSTRTLRLDPTATPEFTHTPGQVLLSPDGSQLLVTTKANGNAVDVFTVRADGRLLTPTVNTLPDTVPFAATFDQVGHVVLTEAGPNAVATFDLNNSGTLTYLDSQATNQAATCWIANAAGFLYASNAGSGSLTGLTTAADGTLNAVSQTTTDAGTVDAAVSSDSRFLYVQSGAAGTVDEDQLAPDGTLTQVGSITIPNATGGEGIAAS
jgi:6-phosphogluconolactonase (cycloisomerase 2 family)